MMTGVTENLSRNGMAVRIQVPRQSVEAPLVGDFCDIFLELPQHPRGPRRCLHSRSSVEWIRMDGPNELLAGLSVIGMNFRDLPVEVAVMAEFEAKSTGVLM